MIFSVFLLQNKKKKKEWKRGKKSDVKKEVVKSCCFCSLAGVILKYCKVKIHFSHLLL